MVKTFKYNPVSDLHCVDPACAGVDLRSAYVNGAVPSGAVGVSVEFNDVDDPSGIMKSPSDTFEAMRQTQSVKDGLAAKKAAAETKSNAATE